MKQLIVIITFCLGYIACNNGGKAPMLKTEDSAKTDLIKHAYEKWLSKHHLKANYFDTITGAKFDSLWAFSEPMMRSDSLYLWFPSPDGSYSLVTNMNWETGKTLFKAKDDVELRFKRKDSSSIFVGIRIPYDHTLVLPLRDFLWYNGNTIYIMEQDAVDSAYELIKVRMDTDSVWSYSSKKMLEGRK